MLSPDHRRFLLNIPKNASSYLCDWTHRNGWFAEKAQDWTATVVELIVVLRDPLERWVSGISQYLTSQVLNVTGVYDTAVGPGLHDGQITAGKFIASYNQVVERLLFDNLDRHDDHVWPQCEIIQDVLSGVSKTYLYIDQGFDLKIQQELGLHACSDLDRNSGSSNLETKILNDFFQKLLLDRPDLKQRIMVRYQEDYDLITKVIV